MLVGAVIGLPRRAARRRLGGRRAAGRGRRRRRSPARRCALDPRVPRDHAAREPDRLRARADDLRRRRRALVVPRQRLRARRRPGAVLVRAARRARPRRPAGRRARRLRPDVARLRLLGLRRRGRRLLPRRGRGPGLNVRAVGESPAAADAMGIDVTRYRYLHTLAGGALAGVGGACFSLALTPQWVDGLTAGAGWIAIALVIFAFWRPDLCLVGAYVFGALLGAAAHPPGARRHDRAAALPGAAVRDDDRRARHRLHRDGAPAARRPRRARHPVRARRALRGQEPAAVTDALAASAMSPPTAWMISGRSSRRARCSGLSQPVHDVAVLEDLRERRGRGRARGSTYCATRSSPAERWKRNENRSLRAIGDRRSSARAPRATRGWRRGSGRRADRGSGSRAPRRSAPRAPRRARAPAGRPRRAPRRRRSRASARDTAREGGGGGSPRGRPAPRPGSARRPGRARATRDQAPRASSPSRSPRRETRPSRARGRSWRRGCPTRRACRPRAGSAGSRR